MASHNASVREKNSVAEEAAALARHRLHRKESRKETHINDPVDKEDVDRNSRSIRITSVAHNPNNWDRNRSRRDTKMAASMYDDDPEYELGYSPENDRHGRMQESSFTKLVEKLDPTTLQQFDEDDRPDLHIGPSSYDDTHLQPHNSRHVNNRQERDTGYYPVTYCHPVNSRSYSQQFQEENRSRWGHGRLFQPPINDTSMHGPSPHTDTAGRYWFETTNCYICGQFVPIFSQVECCHVPAHASCVGAFHKCFVCNRPTVRPVVSLGCDINQTQQIPTKHDNNNPPEPDRVMEKPRQIQTDSDNERQLGNSMPSHRDDIEEDVYDDIDRSPRQNNEKTSSSCCCCW